VVGGALEAGGESEKLVLPPDAGGGGGFAAEEAYEKLVQAPDAGGAGGFAAGGGFATRNPLVNTSTRAPPAPP
jgi:hypothetical protein